ncbi:ABC transporter ATP-binding protein [Oceanotoga sp. DSM 15011]|uniref:Peptide/nickel transport system ATP-binding protein n=1 Tax=Oceanotoga teriensis TaxID=515440 RepID=A0AA45C778_9BACT|nr:MULTISPECIES: ABC transporter ATP-binding protein [Oceanotoga]MDN5341824.1 peptide/nickel transport system ATP-binding protein [Oceanotoga sp.]MDO7976695.1 ABC transporter ATP-binding protein [Oceanotoga teriensis]PWJ95216.1 peptide/nickel transport system ATP-binding protein [Oceanotoga teriensis]UYP00657.1 ABC transporter ATP-binding protein [Oceanotoga sp. DSM 15011]
MRILNEPVLIVKDLRTYFDIAEGTVKAVNGVSFELNMNEALGVVGETGSGKSVTMKSVMGMIRKPGYIPEGSQILFKTNEFSKDGSKEYINLAKLSTKAFTRIRGKHIGMVFQDPMASLNPMYTVADQMIETIVYHQNVSLEEARERAIELLTKVGLPNAKERIDDYPFQFSGGQRQRIIIAISLSCNPEVLIADEPTTALDVTIQAQILELMKDLQRDFETAMVYITHDLSVVAEIADKVMVMYGGTQMEMADVYTIFDNPMHPYTHALLSCIPRHDLKKDELEPIKGQPPIMLNPPPLCPFLPRCPRATERCKKEWPELQEVEKGHLLRCFNPVLNKKGKKVNDGVEMGKLEDDK